jgi:Domain of unknown function (DUF4386)
MAHLSDAHHFRKMVAGFCMVAAPLLLLVGAVLHPESDTDAAAQIASIADSPDQWYVAHLLVLMSIVLAVPAMLGLMHMLREREVAWGHLGGGLAIVGLLAFVGIVAMDGFVFWQAAQTDVPAATALLERVNESAGVVIPFFIVAFGFMLGLLCLAYGLYRARAVQWWMALFLVVASVLLAVGFPAASNLLLVVGAAFLFVGLGSIGRMVLTESDEDWEHTPEYEGFRPMLGTR